MTIITGARNIRMVQWLSVRGAVWLETRGLTHSRGSVAARWKRFLGLKRNTPKLVVLAIVEDSLEAHGHDLGDGRKTERGTDTARWVRGRDIHGSVEMNLPE